MNQWKWRRSLAILSASQAGDDSTIDSLSELLPDPRDPTIRQSDPQVAHIYVYPGWRMSILKVGGGAWTSHPIADIEIKNARLCS